jgi:putative GTP pyrophosphokinase
MSEPKEEQPLTFDFARHEQAAVTEYLHVVGFYSDLAVSAKRIAEEALKRRGIQVHSIEARAKDPASFGRKASKPSKHDPGQPMYPVPLAQITDQAAIRIITFFPRTIGKIDEMLRDEFWVIEHFDKGESLIEEERFGYQSVHYLVAINPARTSLPEYERFRTAKVEVQVRTILQHAWAEIEHDIQYKSSITIPKDIKRRFMSLAGLLEIADREFQAIQDADRVLSEQAETRITAGDLSEVEITAGALKAYLDKTLGPDGRMSDFSYDWTARLLLKLGFTSLEQVDLCIGRYNDDLSRLVDGTRQGQLTRFEYMLLAGLGDKFIERHPWKAEAWFQEGRKDVLAQLSSIGVEIACFDPLLIEPVAEHNASEDSKSQRHLSGRIRDRPK